MGARFCYNPDSFQLNSGADHPLRGDSLKTMPIIFKELTSGLKGAYIESVSEPASYGDVVKVHQPAYVDEVLRRARSEIPLTPETPLSMDLLRSHMGIVGGAMTSVKDLMEEKTGLSISPGGFHHAGSDYGGGFCVFNDVALAARIAQDMGSEKVMIIDTDAHAGNGTMDIFYEDPSVMYVSIHQDPRTLFPGRGSVDEIGSGPGRGYTVNIPVPPYSSGRAFLDALERVVAPIAERFRPDLIIRNGGSDPLKEDPLSDLSLSTMDLHAIGVFITELRERSNVPGLDLILSGYGPSKTEGWKALIAGAIKVEYSSVEERAPEDPLSERADRKAGSIVDQVAKAFDLL